MTLVDSVGIISRDRTDLTDVKTSMLDTTNPDNTQGGLADSLRGADVFIGVSKAGIVAEGYIADLILLDSNPLDDLTKAFQNVSLVMKEGQVVVDSQQ